MVNVKEFIARIGIAQDELAKRLGLKPSTVYSWTSKGTTPTYDVCVKLLEMGMTVEELFGKPYLSSISATHEELDAAVAASLKRLVAKMGDI